MTQIIFQVAAIGCCIYTAYRLGLFIYKKLRKNNKTAKAVQVTSYETSDKPCNRAGTKFFIRH